MIKFHDFIFENVSYHISFLYNGENKKFDSSSRKGIYILLIEWLYENGYEFKGTSLSNRILTINQVKNLVNTSKSYRLDHFHNIKNSGKFIIMNAGIDQLMSNLIKMLSEIGIDKNDIQFSKGEDSIEVQNVPDDEVDVIEKIKVYKQNPFRQAICVIGESGDGKSTTVEKILDKEDHKFQFIIPSASTTGLLSQFSPSISGYRMSRLGKMILEAYKNPSKLYTAVLDECHKSNVIEMINDELLQAISTKRNAGRRFISLDEDTAELYEGVELHRGNILIPDNFGFIFISSKTRIIANNADFFNRVDIVHFKHSDDESTFRNIRTSTDLISKVLSPDEKRKLSSSRND